jgi:hypothetical protein
MDRDQRWVTFSPVEMGLWERQSSHTLAVLPSLPVWMWGGDQERYGLRSMYFDWDLVTPFLSGLPRPLSQTPVVSPSLPYPAMH